MREHTNDAVVVFAPKAPNHESSLRCELKEWELWKQMRDVVREFDAIQKEIEDME